MPGTQSLNAASSVFPLLLLCIPILVFFYLGLRERLHRGTFILVFAGFCLVLFAAAIDFTERLPELNNVPVFGANDPRRGIYKGVFGGFLGLLGLVLGALWEIKLTREKKAEEAEETTRRRLRETILASMGDAVIVVDRENRILFINPTAIETNMLVTSYQAAGKRQMPELEAFFGGAREPKQLIDLFRLILADVRYCNCFICYGEPDQPFAQGLRNDLVASGAPCWLYSMDATPGERTWQEIGEKRRGAEKMVVLCSAQALVRDGVLKEIEEQIDEDPDKMVPVSLDNLWKEPGFRVMRGNHDLKPFLLDRNYADFTKPYEEALERLLKGLERKQS